MLSKHLKLWDKFEIIQGGLDENLTDEAAVEAASERTDFENRYHKICGLLKKYIKKPHFIQTQPVSLGNNLQSGIFTPCQNVIISDLNSRNSTPGHELIPNDSSPCCPSGSQEEDFNQPNDICDDVIQNHESRSVHDQYQLRFRARFELPKLQTPTFHGSFDTWLTFHDSFKSMCHDNPDIPPIQKFHYLKACIKDEAAEVIASLETTGNNYQVAWDLLKTRYDNRKYIVESHIKALFDIPNVSREFPVRALLDNVQKRLRALRALGQHVDQWGALLIFIIREKLNNCTREKWEETVGSNNLPSLDQMLSFLEHRSLIENCQSVNRSNPTAYSKVHPSKRIPHSRSHPRSPQACMATTVDSKIKGSKSSCHLCLGLHQLYSCG